jgi:uncharacterized protein YndB with AHSA1/START domain
MTTDLATAVVRRLLPAPIDVAYAEWLDAEAVADFITPAPGRTGRLEWEPRAGGRFAIEMIGAEKVSITGEYIVVDRPRMLRFTWHSSLGGGFDSVVTVTFEPQGERATLMTIEHVRLPAEWVADHEYGWGVIAGQVEAVLAGESERGSKEVHRPG